MYEERSHRAQIDAVRLQDELRCAKEEGITYQGDRLITGSNLKEMHVRIDEAEVHALRGGQRAIAKLETKIKELGSELESENRRFAEGEKNLRKSERLVKDLAHSSNEDHKKYERIQHTIDQLQLTVKSYKKQVEEAEEVAAINLAKCRKVQDTIIIAEEEAARVEDALGRAKTNQAAA